MEVETPLRRDAGLGGDSADMRHDGPALSVAWRARFREAQTEYKLAVLGVAEPGQTPPPLSRPSHLYLPEEQAREGKNFVTPAAFRLYTRRARLGWGIHPYHCLRNLTSSQALTVNLLSALVEDLHFGGQVIAALTGRQDLRSLESVEIEYAPDRPSSLLGDKTRVDGLLTVRTITGELEMICLEVKLLEKLNSRLTPLGGNARMLNLMKDLPLWEWSDPAEIPLEFNQLFRCHILAIATARAREFSARSTSLMVIHHASDSQTSNAVTNYQKNVKDPQTVHNIDLSEFIETFAKASRDQRTRNIAESIARRYG